MVCCLLSGEPTPLGVPFVVGWAAMTVVGAGCPWVGVTAVGVGCGGGALGGATAVGVVAPMSSTGSLGHVLTVFGGVGFNAIIQEKYLHARLRVYSVLYQRLSSRCGKIQNFYSRSDVIAIVDSRWPIEFPYNTLPKHI